MGGRTVLRAGQILGDYFSLFGPNGLRVTVTPQDRHYGLEVPVIPVQPPIGERHRSANAMATPVVLPTTSAATDSLAYVPPVVPQDTSFLVFTTRIVFEDGQVLSQVAWPSLQFRDLCVKIGERANVSPDTIVCFYEGAAMDMERRLVEFSPLIRSGSRIHAFFSVARALQFALPLGPGEAPPSTPPSPPPNHPQLYGPWGPHVPSGPTGIIPQTPRFQGSGGGSSTDRTSTSEKLHATFVSEASWGRSQLESVEPGVHPFPVHQPFGSRG